MVTPLSASSVIAMSALMLCMPIQPQQLLAWDCPSELAWQIRVQNSGFRLQASHYHTAKHLLNINAGGRSARLHLCGLDARHIPKRSGAAGPGELIRWHADAPCSAQRPRHKPSWHDHRRCAFTQHAPFAAK